MSKKLFQYLDSLINIRMGKYNKTFYLIRNKYALVCVITVNEVI